MELLIVVTTSESGAILAPLARACTRAGIKWGAFFTNDGVRSLLDEEVRSALEASHQSVACQDSWNLCLEGLDCPVELGSQTTNSAMLSVTRRVISL